MCLYVHIDKFIHTSQEVLWWYKQTPPSFDIKHVGIYLKELAYKNYQHTVYKMYSETQKQQIPSKMVGSVGVFLATQ